MFRHLLWVLAAAALSACTSTPVTQPGTNPAPSSNRIGVLNVLPAEYVHYHYGTTVFNNFVHRTAEPEPLAKAVGAQMMAALQQAGLQPVEIVPPPALLAAAYEGNWLSTGFSYPTVRKELQPLLDEARAKANVARVLVLGKASTTPHYQWPAGEGIGVYTKSLMGLDRAYAMLGVSYDVIQPGAYQLRRRPVAGFGEQAQFEAISPFDWPESIDERAAFEAQRAVPLLRKLMVTQTSYVAQNLDR